MAITAFTSPRSGLWPWGQITVAAVGTPVPLNINIGPQTANPNTHPTGMVRQLELACPASNVGNVYLLYNVSGATPSAASTPNFIAAVIPAGMTRPVPFAPINASINADDFVVDADTNNNTIFVVAYYA